MVAGAVLALVMAAGGARIAWAERVHDLSQALVHGKREKTRISAAISLTRLRDPRSLRPLCRALRDTSPAVRALAATALGRLHDAAALPALERARRDPAQLVRRRATAAVALIRSRHAEAAGAPLARAARPETGQQPIYVTLKSASDESSSRADRAARKNRAMRMRSLMIDQLARSQGVTLVAPGSREPPVDPYAIDLTMRRLAEVERGPHVEVECEIRVAVSTRDGKMLSVLTGGAKVQVPKATFRGEYLPELQREALEGAVRSVHRDLVAWLASRP